MKYQICEEKEITRFNILKQITAMTHMETITG